jgi:DHA1 family multidrug resistance protein-like MFS transporter
LETWKRNVWILWFGVILASSSYFMIVPFLPLFLKLNLHVPDAHLNLWAGTLFSVSFLISSLLAPYWGSLADRYGRRRMILRAGIGLAIVYLLGSAVQNPWELLGVRILHGLVSGFVPASIALVATNTPERNMGWALGVMSTAGSTGGILGPLFGGVLSHFLGMRLSFVAASVLLILATFLVWKWVKEQNVNPAKPRSRIREDLKIAWHNRPLLFLLVLLVIVNISILILEPLLTLYVVNLQGRTNGAELVSGIIFSASGIASILFAPLWGKRGQTIGYTRTLILTLLGAGILNIAQLAAHTVWTFGLIRFLYGVFLSGVFPTINALVVQHTDSEFRGRAFGLTTSANQMGALIGPLLGGILGGWFGIHAVFVITGVLLIMTSWSVWSFGKEKLLVSPQQTIKA